MKAKNLNWQCGAQYCSILQHFAGIVRPQYQERVTSCDNNVPKHFHFGILSHLCSAFACKLTSSSTLSSLTISEKLQLKSPDIKLTSSTTMLLFIFSNWGGEGCRFVPQILELVSMQVVTMLNCSLSSEMRLLDLQCSVRPFSSIEN